MDSGLCRWPINRYSDSICKLMCLTGPVSASSSSEWSNQMMEAREGAAHIPRPILPANRHPRPTALKSSDAVGISLGRICWPGAPSQTGLLYICGKLIFGLRVRKLFADVRREYDDIMSFFPTTLQQLDHTRISRIQRTIPWVCLADPTLNQSHASAFKDCTPLRAAKIQLVELFIS